MMTRNGTIDIYLLPLQRLSMTKLGLKKLVRYSYNTYYPGKLTNIFDAKSCCHAHCSAKRYLRISQLKCVFRVQKHEKYHLFLYCIEQLIEKGIAWTNRTNTAQIILLFSVISKFCESPKFMPILYSQD